MIIKELDLNAIDEINKEIHSCLPKGGIVLLKGVLASGKTTLVDMIIGLYKPLNGQILIDNKQLNIELSNIT